MMGILKRWSGKRLKRATNRPDLMVEPMEGRALMAANAFAMFAHPFIVPVIQFQSGNTYAVVVTSEASRPLLDALKTLLANLDSAYGSRVAGPANPSPQTPVTPATIQANVDTIATLVGPSGALAVAKLGTDVNAVVAAGTFTAQTRAAVTSDVRSILVGEGASATLLLPAFGAIPGPGRAGSPRLFSADDLTDPNTLGTFSPAAARGQSTSTSANPTVLSAPSPGGGLPGSGALGSNYRRLIDDVRAALAKSQAITAAQRSAISKDFAEIVATAHRPSSDSINTLKADLKAQSQAGALNDAGRAKITADLQAILTSAGVADTLRDRAIADFQPILQAADLDPTALRKILVDIANLLTARPKSVSPLGTWFLGGRPR